MEAPRMKQGKMNEVRLFNAVYYRLEGEDG